MNLAACALVHTNVRRCFLTTHTFVFPVLQETQRQRVSSALRRGKIRERWAQLTPSRPFLPPSALLFPVSWWGMSRCEGELGQEREVKEHDRKHPPPPSNNLNCPRRFWTSCLTETATENTKQSCGVDVWVGGWVWMCLHLATKKTREHLAEDLKLLLSWLFF